MKPLFVTGGNAPFFPSLLTLLESFAERLPGQRLMVCDYGLTPAQAAYFRQTGQLAERPFSVAPDLDVFRCKAALGRYLASEKGRYDMLIWLDGDLTLMRTGIGDFAAVADAMDRTSARVAACGEAEGLSIADLIGRFDLSPFAHLLAEAKIAPDRPYFSSGLFFCRDPGFLERWDRLTQAVEKHAVFEQNMFNLPLADGSVPHLALDCTEWQAQGRALRQISVQGGAARLGARNIKSLHATSPDAADLLITAGKLQALEFEMEGFFKLFAAGTLRMEQLRLLATHLARHGERMLSLGLCRRAQRPIEGFTFAAAG